MEGRWRPRHRKTGRPNREGTYLPAELPTVEAGRDAGAELGVAFFFRQWGAWASDGQGNLRRVGKKKAGRVLDGQTHNAWPGQDGK